MTQNWTVWWVVTSQVDFLEVSQFYTKLLPKFLFLKVERYEVFCNTLLHIPSFTGSIDSGCALFHSFWFFKCFLLWSTAIGRGITAWRDFFSLLSISGWGAISERSSMSSWLSSILSWEVPGMFPDCTKTCKFKRNSYNFDSAPNIRLPVVLNSREIFLSACFQYP